MRPLLVAGLSLLPVAGAYAATIEQMAGQMIIIGFQGDSTDSRSVEGLKDALRDGRIGGVMYLKTNVKSLDEVKAMNAAFRAATPDLPPFLTLDQEGGAVERLTAEVGFDEVPNARTVAETMDPAAAETLYAGMARGLADLGFTVNFGPVADLDLNKSNQIVAKFGRAFSADPETVTAYDAAFVKAHRQQGVLTALKHFPGHGSSTKDSHEGFVDISKSWRKKELEPYKALIAQDLADFIMVGHLYHKDHSPKDAQLPASLSPDWITGVLREKLGYQGVVISDDLEMGAIREHFSTEETVTMAVRAGMDVLLFSNTAKYRPGLGDEIRGILVAEAEKDPKFARRIEESYGRILALKARIGK